jgi:hypothetical protein
MCYRQAPGLTKPFNSMYFAVQAMAAELSTDFSDVSNSKKW